MVEATPDASAEHQRAPATASLDVLEAKSTRRACGGGWMRSEATGRVVPKTCKSWLCSECNVWLREGARKKVASGCFDRPTGYDVALFTFTEPARATLDLPAFLSRHERTIKALRRRGAGAYCTAVEFQDRGALHPHVLVHWPNDRLNVLRGHGEVRRSRDAYRFWSGELRELAVALGWGPVCDAEAVETFTGAATYVVKQLAGYATKEAYRRFKEAGAQRVRPLRASQDWAPRLREFQRGEQATDPGPWVDVTSIACGFARGGGVVGAP